MGGGGGLGKKVKGIKKHKWAVTEQAQDVKDGTGNTVNDTNNREGPGVRGGECETPQGDHAVDAVNV